MTVRARTGVRVRGGADKGEGLREVKGEVRGKDKDDGKDKGQDKGRCKVRVMVLR